MTSVNREQGYLDDGIFDKMALIDEDGHRYIMGDRIIEAYLKLDISQYDQTEIIVTAVGKTVKMRVSMFCNTKLYIFEDTIRINGIHFVRNDINIKFSVEYHFLRKVSL
jgi:hypothetical protein